MSDHWITVIPATANYVPPPGAQRKGLELFRRLAPSAEALHAEATDTIRFIDCGANLQRILCPSCEATLPTEWWQETMEREANAGFPLNSVKLPCCGALKSLDRLEYDWPQGFARFSIEAMNPGMADLTDEQLQAFEAALGCRVRQVRRHI